MKETVKGLLKKTSALDYVKLAMLLVGFGVGVGRMEYKFNEGINELKGVINQHITEDKGQKELINWKHEQLKADVEDNTRVITTLRSEFIRPEDLRRRSRQR